MAKCWDAWVEEFRHKIFWGYKWKNRDGNQFKLFAKISGLRYRPCLLFPQEGLRPHRSSSFSTLWSLTFRTGTVTSLVLCQFRRVFGGFCCFLQRLYVVVFGGCGVFVCIFGSFYVNSSCLVAQVLAGGLVCKLARNFFFLASSALLWLAFLATFPRRSRSLRSFLFLFSLSLPPWMMKMSRLKQCKNLVACSWSF